MHYDSNANRTTVRRLYIQLRTGQITLVEWAAAMRRILGV